MFNHHTKTFQNGLQVVTVPLPALKSVSALLVVNTGSRFEKKGYFGAAHLLEHLVFKGTRSYPTSLDLSIALDSVGAMSNAFTSKESTGYYVTAASRHLWLSLKILKELIFYPLLREEDVEQEKLVVAEEIRMHHDAPDDFIAQKFEQMVYQDTGLSHPISGSLESVAGLNSKKLMKFLKQWYGLENMILVIAGDEELLTTQDFFKKVEAIFSQQPEGRANHHQQKREHFLSENPVSTKKEIKYNRDTEQTHVIIGWPGLKHTDPQRYVLTALSTVLGGNRSSRLFSTIREQAGLAYYVHSNVDRYHDGGIFGANAGLNSKKAEEGIELIIEEFEKIAAGKEPITDQELSRAKNYLVGKILLSLENSYSVAQQYALSKILLGKIEKPDKIITKIKNIKLEQVHALAAKIIKKDEVRIGLVQG